MIPIYESKFGICAPKVTTEWDTETNSFIVRLVNRTRRILNIIIGHTIESSSILIILNTLETEVLKLNIKLIQWPKNDLFFTHISIEIVKEKYLQQHRKLKIALISPEISVTDPLQQETILGEAHINSQTNHHYSRTKTLQRLKSQFYWPHITLHTALYIKSCEVCKNKSKPTEQHKLKTETIQLSTNFHDTD